MAKVIEGTQDFKKQKAQVEKSTFGTRKIRCQKCQSLAVETSDGKGGVVLKCLGCGTCYASNAMG